MKQRVLEELRRIERQNHVRVLLAVESGSRAWGFASPDSDYDVRFIYAHGREWYLSIFESRDVIEEMLPDQLDVSGWELRKALRLFAKCNLALNEWLGSPITYSADTEFRLRLAELIPQYFNPIGALHHYRSMAERALAGNLVDGRIPIKKLFYTLRALLACRWIERTGTHPPTEFARLTTPLWITTAERRWMEELLERKSLAVEGEPILLEEARAESIRAELARYASAPEFADGKEKRNLVELDQLLRTYAIY